MSRSLLQRSRAWLGRIIGPRRADTAPPAANQEAEEAAKLARASMAEAQAANRAKTQFLANMSHELRTPLNAIIGFADMMASGLPGPDQIDKYQEYARDIHESGCHLLALINDILDLSKIEAGKLELHDDLIDVTDAVGSCMTIIKERAQEAGLALHHEVPDGMPGLIADERKVKQIMINLLSNAVKFTPEGGEVVLYTALESDRTFAIRVSDTGIGMAEEDIAKALAPFTQVGGDLSRAYEGTGLGLALSKALVELHGGSLTVESKMGRGTTVTARFPAGRVRWKAA